MQCELQQYHFLYLIHIVFYFRFVRTKSFQQHLITSIHLSPKDLKHSLKAFCIDETSTLCETPVPCIFVRENEYVQRLNLLFVPRNFSEARNFVINYFSAYVKSFYQCAPTPTERIPLLPPASHPISSSDVRLCSSIYFTLADGFDSIWI